MEDKVLLTYEELTALCNKQKEYIKELEEKCSETKQIIKVEKPDYEQLFVINEQKDEIIQALLYSIRKLNNERLLNEYASDEFRAMLMKERAKVDELEAKRKKKNEN